MVNAKILELLPDVDIGRMQSLQENLYTWETMVSTALHQLGESAHGTWSHTIVFVAAAAAESPCMRVHTAPLFLPRSPAPHGHLTTT